MAGLLDAIQSALTEGEKAVTGISSGISAMLSSKKDEDKNSNVIYASFGMAGRVGQQQITGSGKLPAAEAKSTYKAKVINTEKLLTDIIAYLVPINNTLKEQINFDRMVYEENALAKREAQIEQNSAFSDLGKRYGAANDNQKSSLLSNILGVLKTLASFAFDTLLGSLKTAIKAFSIGWKWLRGISWLNGIKNLFQLAVSIAKFLPRVLTVASSGAVLIFTGTAGMAGMAILDILEAEKDANERMKILQQKYGLIILDSKKSGGYMYQIGDKKYKSASELPSKYRDILEAYGPNNRGGTSDAARKRIEANKAGYEPDTMAKELNGGQQMGAPAPGVTQPTSNSGQSAYDVVLGYGKFGKPEDYFGGRKLTQLTVAEALQFGKNVLLKNSGNLNSSAMGAYQITYTTLNDLVKAGAVSESDLFNAETQDKAAKALYNQRNKQGTLNKTWAHFMNTGEGSSSMSFEQAKPLIMAGEGTSGKTNASAESGASSSSGGLIEQATTAVDNALTNIADFIGTIGGKIVGPGVLRNLTTTGPDFAKMISDESNNIQNEIMMGQKKVETKASNVPIAAQSLRMASPNGSISVVDPNYSGSGGIEKYLAHYKLAL